MTYSTSPHNTRWRHTSVSFVEVGLTKDLIVKHKTCLSMSRSPLLVTDVQTWNPLVYEPSPCYNYDLPYFDQPPQYHINHSPPQDLDIKKDIDDVNLQMNEIMELIRDRYQIYEPPISFDEPEESNDDTKCSVPFDSPLFPCTNVLGDVKVDIDLPFGEVDTLSMGDKEIDLNYHRDVENLGSFLADDPVLNPKMFDDPFRGGTRTLLNIEANVQF
ncbi:hypothetical protein Tco_0514715 [Tanacetum coccineum]